jgi:hypothetical protein
MHTALDVVAVPTGTDPLVADDFPEPPHAARTKRAGSRNRTIRSRDRFRTPRDYSPNATTEASGASNAAWASVLSADRCAFRGGVTNLQTN